MAEEIGSGEIVIASDPGALGRIIFGMQRRISILEQMNSSEFTGGIKRVSSALPPIGIVNFG